MKTLGSIFLVLFSVLGLQAQSTVDLKSKVNTFVETIEADKRDLLFRDFDAPERTEWTNLPVGLAARPGIRYGDFTEKSRIAFHDLLITLLSSQGYLKVNNIMHLDDYLLEVYEIAYDKGLFDASSKAEIDTLEWGHGNYYVSIWGDLESDPWSLKFEGHHVSLNITVIDEKLTMTPLFLGSDPALVRETKFAGLRSLSKEEDYGLELINMLTDEQKQKAIFSEDLPKDIITAPGAEQRLTKFQGIKGADLSEDQKEQLEFIIMEYIGSLERDQQDYYQDLIQTTGLDEVYFGWIGGTQRVTDHYYIINSPDILIEYDNVGWIYKGDHIHTIFRDKKNDFAEDLLKKHYRTHKHE